MVNFTLPNPIDAGYYDDPELDQILTEIKQYVATKLWRFRPQPSWNRRLSDVNNVLVGFGWVIKTDYATKGDSATWVLVPTANMNSLEDRR